MSTKPFTPTDQQKLIIAHRGSAFIAACPGAGKTRVMVERARRVLSGPGTGRGIAFLSFTLAAVSELEDRLRREGLIDTPHSLTSSARSMPSCGSCSSRRSASMDAPRGPA